MSEENIAGLVAVGALAYFLSKAMKGNGQPPPDQSGITPGAQILQAPTSNPATLTRARLSPSVSYPPGKLLQLVAYIKNTSTWDSGPNQGQHAPFTFHKLVYTVWEGSLLPGHGALLHTLLNAQPLALAPFESVAVYSEQFAQVQGSTNRRDVGLKLYDTPTHVTVQGEWDDVYYVDLVPQSLPAADFFESPVAVEFVGQAGFVTSRRGFAPPPVRRGRKRSTFAEIYLGR